MNFFCEVFSFTPSPVFVQKSIALFAIALFRFIAKTDLFYLLCHEFLYYTSIVSYYRGFRHTKKIVGTAEQYPSTTLNTALYSLSISVHCSILLPGFPRDSVSSSSKYLQLITSHVCMRDMSVLRFDLVVFLYGESFF